MSKQKDNEYLLLLCKKVNTYLRNEKIDNQITDILVSYCTVFEKVMKHKLLKKNPILIYDSKSLCNDEILVNIINKKEIPKIKTVHIEGLMSRISLVFPRFFNKNESSTIRQLFDKRNHLVHSPEEDSKALDKSDKNNVLIQMKAIWTKMSKEIKKIFGKYIYIDTSEEKYDDKMLEEILVNNLKKKIFNPAYRNFWDKQGLGYVYNVNGPGPSVTELHRPIDWGQDLEVREKCPRCGKHKLSIVTEFDSVYRIHNPGFLKATPTGVYLCDNCGLELTDDELRLYQEKLRDF